MKIITSTLLLVAALCLIAVPVVNAVQGREYVQREREIVKMAKAMAEEEKDVKRFGDFLKELDDCNLSESSRDFWMTARDIRGAMELELAEVAERVQKHTAEKRENDVKRAVQQAEMMDATPLDTSAQEDADPLSARYRKMELTYREAEGLRNPMSMHEQTVIKRYRFLVGQFHELMKEDIADMQAEIDTLKDLNRKSH